ncbi:MAG: EndoU domain-containing protein [Candidatus Thiodiazotropha sp. 6PLUC9]
MTTPNLFTNSAPAQSYTAVNGGMDGADQTEGQSLFQQASQSHQPDVLVKRQFEQRNQNQKSKLANEFVASAGREGVSQLAVTPNGQHALAMVYDNAGSDGRGLMRQVHEEQGSTAVDYTPESGLVCTAQAAQQGEKAPEEQYLGKLMKQYADHTSGEMPLPPSESLGLRSEIERVSEIVNPGQQNMWGEYTPQEKQYLDEQALRERQAANNLGMWVGGPVFSAMPATARLLGAPEPVVEGFGQINAEIAGGKAFGRQGRGIEPVRVPISGGPVKTYVQDTKSVKIEQPGSAVLGQGVAPKIKTEISPEMESKILFGERIVRPNGIVSNQIRGAHSPTVNDSNQSFAVETLSVHADGTRSVKIIKQFEDGSISRIKSSTLFPEGFSEQQILEGIMKIGNQPATVTRIRDGATLHQGTISSVNVEVIKIGDNVTSGYPTGGGFSTPESFLGISN